MEFVLALDQIKQLISVEQAESASKDLDVYHLIVRYRAMQNYQTAAITTITARVVKVLHVSPGACAWVVNAFVAVIPNVQRPKLV
ncbi:unnamed protein product [Enterobius vermicularis]|uniref:FAT domain-containing protein n=1 Tax=Enterobius vermicularis TaxID=51028 RepID=A0A0N4USV7_ENTVE|nr:unnamed protein product [Enterobius vermicularis]